MLVRNRAGEIKIEIVKLKERHQFRPVDHGHGASYLQIDVYSMATQVVDKYFVLLHDIAVFRPRTKVW